jgi:oligo-1,6-glucosidase
MKKISLLIFCVLFFAGVIFAQSQNAWWKSSVVYQIYPRSFKDSNGDGIGDLKGVTQKLDYLKNLGIETVWISPFFKSPMDDNGYDVSDYEAIDPLFGTMADFDEMLREMKKRRMKLVIDLVVNHSSDEHRWFQEARKSKDNPYHDYYIWKDGVRDAPPNNWISFFTPSAWEWNEATGEYYLHLFSKKQPDLNWDNPKLRQEIYKMMRFWLGKGVDGFRMDVIPFISKDKNFPDMDLSKGDLAKILKGIVVEGPRMHEYLQEMNREVFAGRDVYTVGEGFGVTTETVLDYVAPERKELATIYYFDHTDIDREGFIAPKLYEPINLKRVLNRWNAVLQGKAPNTFYLGNHDQARSLSRFGSEKFPKESAKMLATLLFTYNAIPFVYQGDEIGMTNYKFQKIEEFNDISAKGAYQTFLQRGLSPEQAVENLNITSRDHARTPFQWNDSKNAGFSDAAATWLKVNPNFSTVNAKSAQTDADSIWNFYRKMLALRKKTPALRIGTMEDLDAGSLSVYSYLRSDGKNRFWVVLNMTEQTIDYRPTRDFPKAKLVLSNYNASKNWTLQPFEARIYRVK